MVLKYLDEFLDEGNAKLINKFIESRFDAIDRNVLSKFEERPAYKSIIDTMRRNKNEINPYGQLDWLIQVEAIDTPDARTYLESLPEEYKVRMMQDILPRRKSEAQDFVNYWVDVAKSIRAISIERNCFDELVAKNSEFYPEIAKRVYRTYDAAVNAVKSELRYLPGFDNEIIEDFEFALGLPGISSDVRKKIEITLRHLKDPLKMAICDEIVKFHIDEFREIFGIK